MRDGSHHPGPGAGARARRAQGTQGGEDNGEQARQGKGERGAWEGRQQLRVGEGWQQLGGRRGVLMNGQLRRAEQLSGRAGVAGPVPHVGRPLPPAPLTSAGRSRALGPPTRLLGGPSWQSTRRGTEGVPGPAGARRSRTFCRQNPLGFPTRHSRSHPAQGAPGYPRRARRGRGQPPGAAGWGWGPGLCPLSLSPEPPAETRPHQRARQPARGRLPLWGPLVNPDPTSLWSGL